MTAVRWGRTFAPLIVLALASCNSTGTGVAVASLTRPADIAFACLDEETWTFFPTLSECEGITGSSKETRRLISFVVESTRGEVGAVDWQTVRAIDSNRTVPGYTFVRVGESPSAIVIPPNDTRMTFVANYGSFSVQSLETAAFVPDAAQDDTDELHPATALLPSGPSDLVYAEAGGARWLFATLPDLGSIAQIPVNADGSFGTPMILAVSTTVPAQVAPTPNEPEFVRMCPTSQYARAATASLRTPVSRGLAAKPNQAALLSPFELVTTDSALPMLHRFTVSAAGLTEVPGFAVAVPTIALATTPPVPESNSPAPPAALPTPKQFVYAIDGLDRSVLVVDVGSGAVVPVNVGDRESDRIPFSSRAIALETLTPGWDISAGGTLVNRCNPADAADTRRDDTGPTALRGVFVAVSTTDGFVGIVDVFDMDADCRGTVACGGVGESNDEIVAIRRHRQRVGGLTVEPVQLSSTLSFAYDGNGGGISSSGRPTASSGPGLDPIDDGRPADDFCPGERASGVRGQMTPILVSSGDAALAGKPLICVLDDANSVRAQSFVATYEGTIPTAAGARGRLSANGGTRTFDTEDGTFCGWGVLGSADVSAAGLAATDPEAGYVGDMLVVTSNVSPELAKDELCKDLVIPDGSTVRIRIGFEILEAHSDHLVLGNFIPDASVTVASRFNTDPVGAFEAIRTCFPTFVNYEIRAHGAYVVTGSTSIARHRVVDDGAGRCSIDVVGKPYVPDQPDTAFAFRALPGRPFVHPQVAFQISAFAVPSGIDARLVFDVLYAPPVLRIDGGGSGSSLEPALHFNLADARLYSIDSLSHAVTQFHLDPITTLNRVQ